MRSQRFLPKLLETLETANVEERTLVERKQKPIRGYADGHGTVVVNPIPDILDTLIHELFHEAYPKWSESYVKARTTELVRSLSHDQQQKLYKEYCQCRNLKKRLSVA